MISDLWSSTLVEIVLPLLGAFIMFAFGFFIRLVPSLRKKQRMHRFLGVNPQHPRLITYLSTILVLPRTTATFRYKPEDDKVVIGGFTGPTISAQEIAVVKYVVERLQIDPFEDLPFIRKMLESKYDLFKRLDLNITNSPGRPLPFPEFEFGPLISVGSGTYNSVSDYYTQNYPGYLQLVSKPECAVEVIKGTRKGQSFTSKSDKGVGGLAVIEKTIDDEHGNVVFLACGAGPLGSVGATIYLVYHWEELAKKYGDKSFAVMLEIDADQTSFEKGKDGIVLRQIAFFP